jgi:hypothetical protein
VITVPTKTQSYRFLILILGFVTFVPLILAGGALGAPSERILNFDSRIQIFADGHLIVTETIEVISAGDVIKHGIYRDFPTRYKDHDGRMAEVGFSVLNVTRDGMAEAYHTKSLSNGIRIYMGKRDTFISPGVHTYTLTYRTDRQLGFFDEHDELYWNVTGNGWSFQIDQARAELILPARIEPLKSTAYTGPQGSREQAFERSYSEVGNITFKTTRALAPREGLTIVVAWPKGIVDEPRMADNLSYSAKQNAGFLISVIAFVVLFAYYLLTWMKVGRDPQKRAIIPRFKPPEGLSPAAVRYVHKRRFDRKSLTATVVSLAVKGVLTISQEGSRAYTLQKIPNADTSKLSKGEKKVFDQLFKSKDRLELGSTHLSQVKKAVGALKKSLSADFSKAYFANNTNRLLPGIGIVVIALVAMVLTARDTASAAGLGLWLSMWTIGCTFLGYQVWQRWREPASNRSKRIGRIVITLFSLPFFGAELIGLWAFAQRVSPRASLFFFGMLLLTILFYHLLKAPTIRGREVMDEIEGFQQYLRVAESERLKILNPPNQTPDLFEKFLPYAIALNAERQWSQQFADVLRKANNGKGYRAHWYTGPLAGEDFHGMASNLGEGLSSAVASSATPPGSSSGFGGGGGAGGGGGGGGGGGW